MQNNYIIELLNLQDKNITITNIELIDNTYFIYFNINNYPTCCKHCGSTNIIKHTDYQRTIRYQNILNYKCVLKFSQKRFYCKDCKRTFN